jgi:PAS domain S-box-containing protein
MLRFLGDGETHQHPVDLATLDLATLIVENAADPIFVIDAEERTVFANPAAERTFGWSQAELSGKVLHDVMHYQRPDRRPLSMTEGPLGKVLVAHQIRETHEGVFFHRDGTPIHVTCSNAPVLRDGLMVGAVLIAVDITERKRIQQELADALAVKEALVKEVHHRVKNSLMMVVSFLRLQAHKVPDITLRQHFEGACHRVATVARMHERLYRMEKVEAVEFGDLLRELCADIAQTNPMVDGATLEVAAEAMELATDCALPLALVTNELVTNAIKHAFRGGRAGRVHVRFGPIGGGWELSVADDGVGLPDGFDPQTTGSLGMRLVTSLSEQIGARLSINGTSGTTVTLRASSLTTSKRRRRAENGATND